MLACRVLVPDYWCHECGAQGMLRNTVLRELAHVPLGWRPTILAVRVRRFRCTGCGHVWRQDTATAAASRSKLSRHAALWALKCVVIDRLSIARVAANLGASWHTVNGAVFAAGSCSSTTRPAWTECESSASTSTAGVTPAAATST